MDLNAVCRVLGEHGWRLSKDHGRSSAIVLEHPCRAPTFRLSIHRPHGGRRLKKGAVASIMKNAGITVDAVPKP